MRILIYFLIILLIMTTFNDLIFETAPVPMWLQDLSGLKRLFEQWRLHGIQNLSAYLLEDKSRLNQCLNNIKILHANQSILNLFEANSFQHLAENINLIYKADVLPSLLLGLEQLWQGQQQFSYSTVHYSLLGNKLDIEKKFTILPSAREDWSAVLIVNTDVSQYRNAQRQEEHQRQLAEGMFQYSPASLWVEDFSRIKAKLDHVRNMGIEDFRTFLDVHPEFIEQCMQDIIIIDVNQATLELFVAPNKQTLIQNLPTIFAKEMVYTFKEQLIELWQGHIHHRREAVNYALDGSIRHVLLQFSVFPGYENDWSLVQLSLTDITARKKAESYLEYLGKHDVLTKLFNRSFYIEEINRLERTHIRVLSCIYIDMNGLKKVNDSLGHDSGDAMLRRLGDILNQAIQMPHTVSRIGGDEFVILMPNANAKSVESIKIAIDELLKIDNQFYSSLPMSIAMGSATLMEQETIEEMIRRADQEMYNEKYHYYQEQVSLGKNKGQH